MSQADSINTTSRRGFLAKGAATVAGGATILAMPTPIIAHGLDPIFAAIENHKAVRAAWIATVGRNFALEEELPSDRCRSHCYCDGEERILETDDPRWIESEREVIRTSEAESEAAVELVNVLPTTRAGVIALMQYANANDTDGEAWPPELISDDGTKIRSWQYFLIENVAAALTNIA